jgi:hypothetical protein
MDDLTLMRSFRAERVEDDPEARADAWRALEARFEMASGGASRPVAPRRRGLISGRRRLLAFVGTMAMAALLAGVLVLSSGPTAEPAAAEILHRTASVAAGGEAPDAAPGPGQFIYRKFQRLELQGWVPGPGGAEGPTVSMGAPIAGADGSEAFTALVPTTQEWWDAPDGAGRVREVAGAPRFLTSDERSRWEAAGSPLPAPFGSGSGVVDTEHPKIKGFHLPDTSSLPTEPEALRQAVESRGIRGGELDPDGPSADPLSTERTIAGLFDILTEGISTTPQLRAAAFNALAELPGIEVDTDASDFLGRQGDAIRSIDERTGSGSEFIFDPATSKLLADREFVSDPQKWILRHLPEGEVETPSWKAISAGLTVRETAYLSSGVVDSTHEAATAADGAAAYANRP